MAAVLLDIRPGFSFPLVLILVLCLSRLNALYTEDSPSPAPEHAEALESESSEVGYDILQQLMTAGHCSKRRSCCRLSSSKRCLCVRRQPWSRICGSHSSQWLATTEASPWSAAQLCDSLPASRLNFACVQVICPSEPGQFVRVLPVQARDLNVGAQLLPLVLLCLLPDTRSLCRSRAILDCFSASFCRALLCWRYCVAIPATFSLSNSSSSCRQALSLALAAGLAAG